MKTNPNIFLIIKTNPPEFESLSSHLIALLQCSPILKIRMIGIPVVAQQLTNPNSIHEVPALVPTLISELRIQCCCKLWCSSQMWLGSGVTVAVV